MIPITMLASISRWLQARIPDHPVRRLTRLSSIAKRWPHRGAVRLGNIIMFLDTAQSAERWLRFSGNYQLALTAALQRYTPQGAYCLDVGSNLGFYALKMARWAGASGRVAAFEANPAMVKRIEQNAVLNHFDNLEIVNQAVSNHSGETEFYIAKEPGKSSVFPMEGGQKITVTMLKLDDYLHSWPRLDVIKMDIEGNDCYGLLGGRNSIARFRPFIVFEFTFSTPELIARETFEMFAARVTR